MKKSLPLSILAILLIGTIILFLGCINSYPSGLATAGASGEKLKIGIQTSPSSSLVIVADEKGFFKEQGLDVEIVDFSAGKFALQAFLAKQLDFCVVGDVPVVLSLMNGNDFYVISQTVSTNNESRIIALKENGLENAKDFFLAKKRKLSSINGGTIEFFTYNFLKYYGITPGQVEIIFMKPEDGVAALAAKSVDAMSNFEPYPFIAEEKLPGQTTSFTLPNEIYSSAYVLTAQKDWVEKNPEKAVKFLKALIKAEDFIAKNPEESQKIVSKGTSFSEAEVKGIWKEYNMKAEITEKLLKNWNAEAAWAIETGKTKETQIPDFEKILKRDLLEKAKNQ